MQQQQEEQQSQDDLFEEIKSLRRDDSNSARSTTTSVEELNPITRVNTREITRQLSEAKAQDEAPTKKSSVLKDSYIKLLGLCRPAFILDQLNVTSLKIASRTWLSAWVVSLLMIIPKSLHWMGAAAYLGLIVSLLVPVGGESVISACVTSLLILSGVTIGFLGNVIIMAINAHIRGNITVKEVAESIIASGECPVGDASCIAVALLDGRYINAHTNAVVAFGYFITLAIIVWFSTIPSLATMVRAPSIISFICTTINIVYSSHIPYFAPWTVGSGVYKPLFMALACRTVLAVIWFPSTSSANVINKITVLMARISNTGKKLSEEATSLDVGSEQYPALAERFGNSFHPSPMFWAVLGMDTPLTEYELVYSRLDSCDIGEFIMLSRRLASVHSTFTFFFSEILDFRRTVVAGLDKKEKKHKPRERKDSDLVHPLQKFRSRKATFSGPTRRLSRSYDTKPAKLDWLSKKLSKNYLETGNFEKTLASNLGEHHNSFDSIESIDKIFHLILDHYQPMIDSANKATLLASEWLHEANKFRSTALLIPAYRKTRIQRQREYALKMQDTILTLEREYSDIQNNTDWMTHFLYDRDDLTEDQKMYALSQDMFYGYLAEQLLRLSRKVCRWCSYIDHSQPGAQFILPKSGNLGKKRAKVERHFRKDDDVLPDPERVEDIKRFEPVHNAQRRDPDSTPPRNTFHLLGRAILRYRKALTSDTGIYIIKKAACGLPTMVLFMDRNTLAWAYKHRVVWATIMATLTTSPRAGDCMYAFIVRLVMTFVGGLFGMVCWYISTGNGDGNPYGMAATMAVACLIMTYIRHFSTIGGPAARIVFNMTAILVFCVSYLDYFYPSPGIEVAKGFTVFWMRFVSVLCGLTIGFFFTLFPHAYTTKKAVRTQISALIRSIGDIQATLVNFGLQRYDDEHVHQTIVKDTIMLKLNGISRAFSSLQMTMATLRFEPPLTGFWPSHHYNLLLKLVQELSYLQTIFYAVLNGLERSEDIMKTLNMMGMLDSNLLGGIYSVIYMTSNSLVSGEPLPTITPGHLTRDYLLLVSEIQAAPKDKQKQILTELSKTSRGRSMMIGIHCSELFFRRLDGTLALIKGLVGESFDFDLQLQQWLDHENL